MQLNINDLRTRIFKSSANGYEGPQGFSYYAFISYTEKDEKWAKWLQWELEHYKIPTKVRSENKELPERVKPVFWYKNDLAGAHLSGAIKKELEQSEYMIVVCSPASANKDWVNDEVRYFKDNLKRGDKIIPFIVDGYIKASNPEQECLPIPIRNLPREEELRGIDVREYGKNKALVNIVSTLFNIRFDVLWDRFQREKRRRFTIFGAIVALFAFALFGFWDYYWHTKYEYYVDMADCWGMPTGIIKISNTEADNHYRLYRFEYRKRLLQRVVYVDCHGNPQIHTNTELVDRPSIQELSYNNNGVLTAIECKDATDRTQFIMHLSKDKLAADLKDEDENQAANFIFSSTSVDQGLLSLQQSTFMDRVMNSPSKIGRYIYERDEDGYITKKIYAMHNADNDAISIDSNGISGFEYKRDSLHRVVSIYFLDSNGFHRTNQKGVAGKRYQYDSFGNLAVAEYVDKNGELKYNELHWAKSTAKYDNYGYLIEERFYGTDNKPCISANGFHKVAVTTTNNIETVSFYDTHLSPTYSLPLGEDPGGYSIMTNIRNDKGQIVEMQFMDSNGNLCYNQHHVSICKIEYNDRGLISGIRNYGIDQKPCSNISGYHYECARYNQRGNEIEHSFFNIKEKPAQNNLGIHRVRLSYDNTGERMTEAHVYNSSNLPFNCLLFNGAAWIRFNYHGSSKWVSEILFYGFDNSPIETSIGAKVSCERDSYGQIKTYKYYDINNQLYSNEIHCAIIKLNYNDMGMVTDRSFYDENNNPTLQSGVFRVNVSFTNNGQADNIYLYDTSQRLHNGPEGWAIQSFTYINGVVSANSYFGENKEPIEIKGVHKYVYEIDDSGYVISQSAYNKDMQPTINTVVSAHKVVNQYDDNRRIVGKDYYDSVSKTPFVCIRTKYNPKGLQTEQTAYNSRNELVESPLNFGVSKLKSEYDSLDRIQFVHSVDHNGNTMNTAYGFAEAHFSYADNILEVVFLDDEKHIVNNNGYFSAQEPFAYGIVYRIDAGDLFYKRIRRSFDNSLETIRTAYCYDALAQNIQKVIRCEKDLITVFDLSNQKQYMYYSFEDEYEGYRHMVDSIEYDAESKFGSPRLYHYVKQ